MTTENIDIRVSEDGSRVVRRRIEGIADSADKAQSSVDRMNSLLKMVGKYLVVSEVMRWADAWSVAASSIKIATKNSYEYVQVQTELFKIAQRTRQEFGALTELYAAVARQSGNLKTSQQGLLLYTENISKALAIQHTSMAAARGPLLQLGQAMASGNIRAQEFNSIMLGLPYVMKVVAENFKGGAVSVMQLRQMMLQGKLESIEFYEAFQRGTKQINKDFADTQVTFSQAFTIFRNELVKFTGTMDSTTGASAKFASVLKFIADNLVFLASASIALVAGLKLGPIIAEYLAVRAAAATTAAAVTAAHIQMTAAQNAQSIAAVESARATVAKTQSEIANVSATQAAILISREASIATLAKANSDIVAARASLQAATNAGALSYALAVKREAEIALTAAELRRSASLAELAVLGQQQARVTAIQTEATAAHTAAVRALAVAQGLGAESAAAYALAQGGAAAATARVGVVAGAATVATRVFTGAVAIMGGPIGVAITALIGLVLWLGNVVSRANDAKAAIDAVNRVNAAKTGGTGVRQSDAEKIQAAQNLAQKDLEEAEDRLDTLNKNIARRRAAGYGESADQLEKQFGAGMRQAITEASSRVEKFSKAMEDAKKYSAETGGAAGAMAREVSQARGAWEATTSGVKTATTIQEKYSTELERSRTTYKAYVDQLEKTNSGGVNNDEIKRAREVQVEVEKEMVKGRDAALKTLKNKGADTTTQIRLEADEQMSILREAMDNQISVRRSAYESEKRMLDSKYSNGLISEAEFQAANLQMVQNFESQQRAIINAGIEAEKGAYEKRRAYIQKQLSGQREKDELTKLDAEYTKFVNSANSTLSKLEITAFERQATAVHKLNGEVEKLAKQDNSYWRQASANVDKEQAIADSKKALAFATEEQVSAYEAYITTGEKHNAQLDKLQEAYDAATNEAEAFRSSIDWEDAGAETILTLIAMEQKADEFAQRLTDAYAKLDVLKNRAAQAAAEGVRNKEFKKNVTEITDAIEDAIFNGGKAGGAKFTDWVKNYFLRNPIRVFLQGQVTAIGNMLGFPGSNGAQGAAGGAGGLMNMASMATNAYSLYNSGLAGWVGSGVGSIFGTAAGNAALGTMVTGDMASSIAAANAASMAGGGNGVLGMGASGTAGTSAMVGAGAFAAVAALALNALGAFKSERKNGGGLAGTLGSGNINAWEEWREGGTLFSGPSFNTFNPTEELDNARAKLEKARQAGDLRNMAFQEMLVTNLEEQYGGLAESTMKQSKVIQDAYNAMRDSVGDMADTLGISSSKVREFTTLLGGEKGLALDGLTAEEQQAKVAEALMTANNKLAEQVLGSWVETSKEVHKTIVTAFGSGEEAGIVQAWDVVTETIKGTKYVASEYAKENETAIETLTRLTASLATVRDIAADLRVPFTLAGLAGADAASKIADAFGGLEAMVEQFSSYINDYYSETERNQNLARRASESFALVGLDVSQEDILNASRPIVRGFVDAMLAKFGPGSPQYVAAIQNANALTSLYDPLDNVVSKSKDAADALSAAADAASDIADKLNAAYEARDTAGSLMDELAGAAGYDGNAYSKIKEARLWEQMSQASYQEQISLSEELTAMVLARYNTEKESAKEQMEFARGLRDYVKSLTTGELSPLTNAQKLAAAQKIAYDTFDKARGGDKDAQGKLQGVADTYLQLARNYYASGEEYRQIFSTVTGALSEFAGQIEQTGGDTTEVSQQTLAEMRKLYGVLESAYQKADADVKVQSTLLVEQLAFLAAMEGGITEVISILSSLSTELGVSLGNSTVTKTAQNYVDLMSSVGVNDSVQNVESFIRNTTAEHLREGYEYASSFMQTADQLNTLKAIYNAVAQYRFMNADLKPTSGYASVMSNGPQLTTGESGSFSSSGDDSGLVSVLIEKVDSLIAENERLSIAVVKALLKSSEDNAKEIVSGVSSAITNAAYGKSLEEGAKAK